MTSKHDAVDLCRAPVFQATGYLVELVSSSADIVVDDYRLALDALGVLQFQSFGVLKGSLLLYLPSVILGLCCS